MEQAENQARPPFREIEGLLDTASFSLETAHMALAIGRRSRHAFLTLSDRLGAGDNEEQEAGSVAVEALQSARAAYVELAAVLGSPDHDDLGLHICFWSAFEWCGERLFSESVRATGQHALRQEIVEARRLTLLAADRLRVLLAPSLAVQ